jgi:hypothetical protein
MQWQYRIFHKSDNRGRFKVVRLTSENEDHIELLCDCTLKKYIAAWLDNNQVLDGNVVTKIKWRYFQKPVRSFIKASDNAFLLLDPITNHQEIKLKYK